MRVDWMGSGVCGSEGVAVKQPADHVGAGHEHARAPGDDFRHAFASGCAKAGCGFHQGDRRAPRVWRTVGRHWKLIHCPGFMTLATHMS